MGLILPAGRTGPALLADPFDVRLIQFGDGAVFVCGLGKSSLFPLAAARIRGWGTHARRLTLFGYRWGLGFAGVRCWTIGWCGHALATARRVPENASR